MKPSTTPSPTKSSRDTETSQCVGRHLRFGWWTLLVFLSFGVTLEVLHGFKAGIYLDVSNSARRLMWTLAHAHGTLLALVNVGFAFTANLLQGWSPRPRAFASASLTSATILIPGGFFLGGMVIHTNDPGLGIVLVPIGAVFLFTAVFLTARAAMPAKGVEENPK